MDVKNRALFVGDVHATVEELDDCQKLIDHVIWVATAHDIQDVVFLGDIYNTHAVVRVEVLAFWRNAFEQLSRHVERIHCLVGNHDFAGEGLAIHALQAHEEQVNVVLEPTPLFPNKMPAEGLRTSDPGVLMLPYVSESKEFVQLCNDNASSAVICHQTFDGAQYDNGMYAPGGVDQNEIPQEFVISGHIHKPAIFGKVTYIGAPRWRTLSDADVQRSIVIFEFDAAGRVVGREDFSTSRCCRQICFREVTPDTLLDPAVLSSNVDWRIDVRGPADFVEMAKALYSRPGVRIRTFKTDTTAPKLKESEGVETSFGKYIGQYTPRFGTPKERLVELAKERLGG